MVIELLRNGLYSYPYTPDLSAIRRRFAEDQSGNYGRQTGGSLNTCSTVAYEVMLSGEKGATPRSSIRSSQDIFWTSGAGAAPAPGHGPAPVEKESASSQSPAPLAAAPPSPAPFDIIARRIKWLLQGASPGTPRIFTEGELQEQYQHHHYHHDHHQEHSAIPLKAPHKSERILLMWRFTGRQAGARMSRWSIPGARTIGVPY